MKHAVIQMPLPDPHGLGQPVLARIQRDVAAKNMPGPLKSVLSNRYVVPEWYRMHSRLFKTFLAEYRDAESRLNG